MWTLASLARACMLALWRKSECGESSAWPQLWLSSQLQSVLLILCRLYAFTDATGKTKPGMIRVTDGSGASIDLEVWEMPIENFGHFMVQVRKGLQTHWVART